LFLFGRDMSESIQQRIDRSGQFGTAIFLGGMAQIMQSSTTFWLGLLFIPVATLLLDLIVKT